MLDHISVSQINQYLMCPLKYRFNYIDRLPKPFKPADLAFGTSIHAAIEWWHKKRQNGNSPSWQEVVSIFEADFLAHAIDELRFKNKDSIDSLLEKGKQLLAIYLKDYPRNGVRATEMSFRVPLYDLETGETIDVPLDGYIDIIEDNDTVVELKTAARSYNSTVIQQHLQLTAYAYAFLYLYKRYASLRIDLLIKSKNPSLNSFKVHRDKDSMIRFFHIAKCVLNAIESGHFFPNEGWQCPGCEYYEVCQKWKS